MKPEVLLPCSQEPTHGASLEPEESNNLQPPVLMLLSDLRLGHPNCLFPSGLSEQVFLWISFLS
jgi:hypothetical protein